MDRFTQWMQKRKNEGLFSRGKDDVEMLAKAMLRIIKQKAVEAGVDYKEVVQELASKARTW
jgi:predicted DNA binding CopG/RHH family protein